MQAATAAVVQHPAHHAQHRRKAILFPGAPEDELGVGALDIAVLQAQAAGLVGFFLQGRGHDADGGVALGRGVFQPAEFFRHQSEGFPRVQIAAQDAGHIVRSVGRAPEGQDLFPVPFQQILVAPADGIGVGAAVEGQLQAPAPGDAETEGDVVVHVVLVHQDLAFGIQAAGFERRMEEGIRQDIHRHGQLRGGHGDVVVGGLVPGAGVGGAAGAGSRLLPTFTHTLQTATGTRWSSLMMTFMPLGRTARCRPRLRGLGCRFPSGV